MELDAALKASKYHRSGRVAAAQDINNDLNQGELKLYLGAGVSIGLGLPNWEDLLQGICDKKNIDYSSLSSNSIKDLLALIAHIDASELSILATEVLYRKVDTSSDLNIINSNPKFYLALTALCSGRTRGHINHIFTTNYDDVLERFFSLLGLGVNSGDDFRRRNTKSDVRIDHIHGYLPRDGSNSNAKLILSLASYEEHMNSVSNEFYNEWFISQCVGSKLFVIGASGEDLLKERIQSVKALSLDTSLGTGYAIISYDKDTVDATNLKNKIQDFESLGLHTIVMQHSQIPEFLIDCCKLRKHSSF